LGLIENIYFKVSSEPALSKPLLKLVKRMIGCFPKKWFLDEMTAIIEKVLQMRQAMTEDHWIKVAQLVNKVVNVTLMIDVEGAARDLAVAWI
jgi:hypothetical protein